MVGHGPVVLLTKSVNRALTCLALRSYRKGFKARATHFSIVLGPPDPPDRSVAPLNYLKNTVGHLNVACL